MEKHSLIILPEQDGLRLDKALAVLLPEVGLRGRRRLCAHGAVLINGLPANEASKVQAGDEIFVAAASQVCHTEKLDQVNMEVETEHVAALFKPAGLHTVSLTGNSGPALDRHLSFLFPTRQAVLLNRLDFATSGLVLAALDSVGRELWERGETDKRYLALLQGAMESELVIRRELDVKNRTRVRAMPGDNPDSRRHTRIVPLLTFPLKDMPAAWGMTAKDTPDYVTLAGCAINKGARHQIRVHAALAGFPLLGDQRYGGIPLPLSPLSGPEERFFLHHGSIRFSGFYAFRAPEWLFRLPGKAAERGTAWLQELHGKTSPAGM